mgnify:CR=1 FL=1
MPSEDEIKGYRLVRWVRPGERTWDAEGMGIGDEFGEEDLFEQEMYDEDADVDSLFEGEQDSMFGP